MTGRQLRARVLLEEARALGLDLEDLVAADTHASDPFPTVRSYLEAIAPTFTPATAATYPPYWRLLVAHLGDHRLGDVTRWTLRRWWRPRPSEPPAADPTAPGGPVGSPASLRSAPCWATVAGLIPANPAGGLTKPRRGRSRRRALNGGGGVRNESRDRAAGILDHRALIHEALPGPLELRVAVGCRVRIAQRHDEDKVMT